MTDSDGFDMAHNATRRTAATAIIWSAIILLAGVAVAPFVGQGGLDFARVLERQSPDYEIFVDLRIPRTLLAALAGGTLSVAGVLFQALLRDPLATPFSLGVSSAAALGAVTAICFGWTEIAGLRGMWVCAMIFAAAVLAIVLRFASQAGRLSSFNLLLTGVTLNSICSALILLLHSLASFHQSFSISRWLMGSVEAVSYGQLGWFSVALAIPTVAVLRQGGAWNAMAFGDVWAAGRGVSPIRMMRIGYVAGSVLAATVTALTGPIGFVGLVVPHMLRKVVGSDHRIVLPCSLMLGAVFLVVCDAIGRTVLAPSELPVGVVTAMIGGPVFIWILQSRSGS
jgi:iron complex transport system permease protein